MGSLISSRQEYPNLLQWGIWVPAQRSRSHYDILFSEASRYPGKRSNVCHHYAMVNKFCSVWLSSNKIDYGYSDYPKSLISRINEAYVFFNKIFY